MNYIRTFSGTLPSLGTYVALDFTKIESVITGKHWIAGQGSVGEDILTAAIGKEIPKQQGTLVRFEAGFAMFFQAAEETAFLEVWNQFVLESQQQERVREWSQK